MLIATALFHFRVLCKFAFSLSQDWELPIKREVSRQHCSSFEPGASLSTSPHYLVLQPILEPAVDGAAFFGSAQEQVAGHCPHSWGRGKWQPLPSSLLSKPQGLSLLQLRRAGQGGEWEVKAALLDAVCLGCPGPACLDASLLVWMRCTDPGLCASLQEKEKKPLKEGVQDMLVKHHLFSWDIDG